MTQVSPALEKVAKEIRYGVEQGFTDTFGTLPNDEPEKLSVFYHGAIIGFSIGYDVGVARCFKEVERVKSYALRE